MNKEFIKKRWGYYLLVALVFSLIIFFLIKLITYGTFEDESETIVASQMMNSGMKLYEGIFNLHGPFTFMPGVLISHLFSGMSNITIAFRIFIAIMNLLSVIIIFRAPFIKHLSQKIAVIAVYGFMICIIAPKLLYNNMYLYETIGGLFSVYIIFLYILPLIFGLKISGYKCVITYALIITLPFIGIPFLPAAFLFWVIGLKKDNTKYIIYGTIIGMIINLTLLLIFCSIKGFIAIHILYNASAFQMGNPLIIMFSNIITDNSTFFSAFSLMILGIWYAKGKKFDIAWRVILLPVAIILLGYRSMVWVFKDNSYWIVYMAVISLLASELVLIQTDIDISNRIIKKIMVYITPISLIIIITCVLFGFKYRPSLPDLNSNKMIKTSLFSQVVKSVTNKNDKILALPFAHTEYILSDRLPASADYWYLPWAVDYNKKHYLGVKFSLLDDIKKNKPKLILSNGWFVEGNPAFDWNLFAKDIQDELNHSYVNVQNTNIWVLKDIYDKNINKINDIVQKWSAGTK